MPDADPNKTVFISYRRKVSSFIARAIFQDLRANGYDVFLDVANIDSGTFDTIILNQIAARAHFLIILTPGTLNRCVDPNDWLRREIGYAIKQGRNIVPILVNDFKFGTKVNKYLVGELGNLPRLNALSVPHEYFDAAMERLRTSFLKQPIRSAILRPTPANEQAVVNQKIEVVANQPKPTDVELSAEDYFLRAYEKSGSSDYEGAITEYSEAIMGQYNLALSGFEKAFELKAGYKYAIAGLAITNYVIGDPNEAKRLWQALVNQDARYLDAEWVRKELDWGEPLVEEARKLIASLKGEK